MRILQLTSSYPPSSYGGDASQVEALHHALNADHSSCTTISFKLKTESVPTDNDVITIESESDLRRIYNDTELNRINKQAVKIACTLPAPQVIHLHTTLFAMAAVTLSQILKCPLVYTAHYPARAYLEDSSYTEQVLVAERLILEKAKAVISVSRWLQNELFVAYPAVAKKMRIVYNGVDTDRFKPVEHSREFLLFVGRLAPQKGLEYLAPLVKQIQEENPLPLVVLGKGDEEDFFRKSLGKCDVAYFGSVPADEISGWMNRAAVLLLPSKWDPCPLVALEAMACGVPVLGSAIPGLDELVIDSETGILTKLDAQFVGTSAARFGALYQNKEIYRAMSLCCRQRAVENFSLSRMTEQVKLVYQEAQCGC